MEFSEQYTYSKRTFIGAARQIRSTFHYLPNLEEKNPTQLCICTFWGPFFLKTYLGSFFKNPALDMYSIYCSFSLELRKKNLSSQNDLFHVFVLFLTEETVSRQGSQAKPLYVSIAWVTNMSYSPDLNIEFSTDSTRTDPQASRKFCV